MPWSIPHRRAMGGDGKHLPRPFFWVMSNDAVNNGAGKVSSITCRITGLVLNALVSAQITYDTASIPGKVVLTGTGAANAGALRVVSAPVASKLDNPAGYTLLWYQFGVVSNANTEALTVSAGTGTINLTTMVSTTLTSAAGGSSGQVRVSGGSGSTSASAAVFGTTDKIVFRSDFIGGNVSNYKNNTFLSTIANPKVPSGLDTITVMGDESPAPTVSGANRKVMAVAAFTPALSNAQAAAWQARILAEY